MSRGSWGIVAVWLGLLITMSAARSHVWLSSDALWMDAYIKAPDKPRVLVNYGELLEVAGNTTGATMLYEHAYTQSRARHDQRSSESKLYVLQDLVRRLNAEKRIDDMWTALIASGCRPSVDNVSHRDVKWTCKQQAQ